MRGSGTWIIVGLIAGLIVYFAWHDLLDFAEPWGSILSGLALIATVVYGVSREAGNP
jgi:hypothetical protein